ncbi:hypothetical protein [Streptomyces boncukensis]|uniref:Uncharacterized protein n=1 Tax=Streptomyces boncukensis TaxID=2711219 RepID=A0A6G4X920_9ACTN|nr:hypothetical protein [Streptomyces boncukensis]NGO73337.1 hypothetical protein [Streptomyces boncukensis]
MHHDRAPPEARRDFRRVNLLTGCYAALGLLTLGVVAIANSRRTRSAFRR